MRRTIAFACAGDTLFGTLDAAPGAVGLLIVSGGNEVRAGAAAGQSLMARRTAVAGHPVFRYDRRGIGDSSGLNRGFRDSRDDIAAAIAAFRAAAPELCRMVALGNCDAASALMLFGAEVGLDALVLANPWAIENADETVQAPAALRRRYAAKLADPAEWRRLVSGAVDLRKLATGLRQAVAHPPPSALAAEMRRGLARFAGPVTILLAERDRTAQIFASTWGADARIARLASASHGFVDEASREWLFERLCQALA